jgi:hypothetical protein
MAEIRAVELVLDNRHRGLDIDVAIALDRARQRTRSGQRPEAAGVRVEPLVAVGRDEQPPARPEQHRDFRALGLAEADVERRRQIGGAPLVARRGEHARALERRIRAGIVVGTGEPWREPLQEGRGDPPVGPQHVAVPQPGRGRLVEE